MTTELTQEPRLVVHHPPGWQGTMPPTEGSKIVTDREVEIKKGSASESSSSSKGEEKLVESKEDDTSVTFKQILSSLAESKKYLPENVNKFLDSMEGKSLDDLKNEAISLASKAQEEAKKKTEEVENYGMSKLENAKKSAQEMADMVTKTTVDATKKTSSLATNSIEMVRNLPMNAVRRTSDLANKSLEIAQDATKATAERVKASPLANRGLDMIRDNTKIVIDKSLPYLPESVKDYYDKNLEGKSLEELTNEAVLSTRKNLLSVEKEEMPDVKGLALEVTDAVSNGKLFKNLLDISENIVSSNFGALKSTPDASNIRRMYNISLKVADGLRLYGMEKFSQTKRNVSDRVTINLYQMRDRIMPLLDRYATPTLRSLGNLGVPFVSRWVPESSRKSGELETESTSSTGIKSSKGTSGSGTVTVGSGGVGVNVSGGERVTITEHVESTIPPTQSNEDAAKKGKKHSKV